MNTQSKWPDPNRPGWPPQPEKDGLYILGIGSGMLVRYWSAAHQKYSLVKNWNNGSSPDDMKVFDYIGRVYDARDLEKLLAEERGRCAKIIESHGISPFPIDDPNPDAEWLNGCLSSCADAVRNLGAAP